MPRRPFFQIHPQKPPLRARGLLRLERRLPGRQTGALGKNGFLTARAGGKTIGGPLPGGRITRPLGVLVAGALLFIGSRYFIGQGLGIVPALEGAARAQYIPLLEKQLGQKTEVGEFSLDWAGRLQVENIVVGRNPKLPTGALLRAKSATATLDLLGLISRRKTPIQALQKIVLEQPQVYIERDARGKINLQSLVKSDGKGPALEWDGQIEAQNGRIYYRDFAQKSKSGARLEVDATQVSALLVSKPRTPFRFSALVGNALLVSKKFRLQNIPLAGAFQTAPRLSGALSLQVGAVPLPLAADFAFPRGDVMARGGTLAGSVRVSLEGKKIVPSGQIAVRDADLELPTQRLPRAGKLRAGQALRVQKISGDALFADGAFETRNLSARFLGGDWRLAGRAFVPSKRGAPATFDVRVQSAALPIARLLELADPKQLPPSLKIGGAALDAQLAGTPQNLSVAGRLNLGQTSTEIPLRNPNLAPTRAGISGARALFAVALRPNSPARFSARVLAPLAQVSGGARFQNTLQTGTFRARDALVSVAGSAPSAAPNAPLEISLDARSWNLQTARLGGTSGRNLRLIASTPSIQKPNFRGQIETQSVGTSGLNFAAFSPQARRFLGASGTAGLRANFGGIGTKTPFFDADANLSNLVLNRAALPENLRAQIPASALALRNLRAQIGYSGGQIRVQNARANSVFGEIRGGFADRNVEVEVPLAALPAREINNFLAARGLGLNGDLRGRVAVATSLERPNSPVRARFQITAPSARLLSRGASRIALEAPIIRGVGTLAPGQNWQGQAQIFAREIRLNSGALGNLGAQIPAQLRGFRARDARLLLVADGDGGGENWPRWNAELRVPRLSAPLPIPALPGAPNRFVTLRDTVVLADSRRRGVVRLARAQSRWGEGVVNATGELRGQNFAGQVLARGFGAGALQTFFAPQTLQGARFQGEIDASAQIKSGVAPRVQVQMARGSAFVPSQNLTLPVSALRGEATLENGRANLRDLRFWSAGAQFVASGSALLAAPADPKTARGNGQFSVRGFRLSRLPLDAKLRERAGIDGLFSGDFRASLGQTLEITGDTKLDGATAAGAEVSAASGKFEATRDEEGGWRVALPGWSGRVENAEFKADLETDLAQNFWRVTFSTPQVAARRIALLQTRTARRGGQSQDGTLPLEGDFFADIDLNGELQPRVGEKGRPFWLPRAGYAILRSQDVRWRGRNYGGLDADFSFAEDLARIRRLELNPPGENMRRAPAIKVTGVLPIAPEDPRLRAQLTVGEAPLEFFRDTVREARLGLDALGIQLTALEKAVTYSETLPQGLQGRIAVKADITGSWGQPSVRVSDLTLRDGRVPLPQGGFSAPATLDAAFSFAGGAVEIQESSFQIAKNEGEKESQDEDDTLLRVEKGGITPNGQINVRADVFNANLSQIATWVPALRGENGAPLLRGTISDFSLSFGGTTQNPEVVGSVLAENLAFQNYSLDRILVSRFEIKGGQASIAPGNLSIVKGGYTSRSAWGRVPIDFSRGGVQKDAPFEVHLPLETRDFTAVAGILVPSLKNLKAEEIKGNLDVGGTLNAPRVDGELRLREVGFGIGGAASSAPNNSSNSAQNTTANNTTTNSAPTIMLSGVSGTLRFIEGNRLVIDADDPLRGRVGGQNPAPAANSRNARAVAVSAPPFEGRADFRFGGGITFDLSPRNLSRPLQTLSRHYYDLRFNLSDANFSSPLVSGFREGEAAIRFRTENGGGAPSLKWMLWARGQKAGIKSAGGGTVQSIGNLRLAQDFGTGLRAISRSQAQEFGDGSDFNEFPVAKRIDVSKLPDRRPQFLFQKVEWRFTGVGRGEVDGRLVLDNRERIQEQPFDVQRFQNAQLRPLLAQLQEGRTNPFDNTPLEKKSWLRFQIGDERRVRTPVEEQLFGVPLEDVDAPNNESENRGVLRLGGQVTLQNAEITGAPSGEAGTPARLSTLPFAPRFDVRVVIGERVQFLTGVFRTGIGGELVASGTPRNPQIVGTVTLREGQIRFPNARARIGEGRLQIAITRDPETDLLRSRVEVEAEATGTSGGYQINLKLRGPLDLGEGQDNSNSRLQVDVTTNPSLSQDVAFAQLLGISPSATSNNGNFDEGRASQAYAQAVLQFVASPFFSGFERGVAQALGLDNVGLEYRFNEALAIQLSKNIGDRVIVSYRRSIGGGDRTQISTRSDAVSPEELRIDYRIKGDYLIGAYRREFQDRATFGVSVQRTWRF